MGAGKGHGAPAPVLSTAWAPLRAFTRVVAPQKSQGVRDMSEQLDLTNEIESERYELSETPSYKFDFARRDFIKAFGVGIVFIVPLTRALAQQRGQGESGRGGFNERLPND